jgi:hypothetical protein
MALATRSRRAWWRCAFGRHGSARRADVHDHVAEALESGGRDFDESDETNIHELAALIGEMLDALRRAAQQPA